MRLLRQRKAQGYKSLKAAGHRKKFSRVPLASFIFVLLFPLLYFPFGADMFDGIKLSFLFVFLPIIFLEQIFIEKIESFRLSRSALFLFSAALWAALGSLFSVLPREAFFGEYTRRTGALLFILIAFLYFYFEQRKEKGALKLAAVTSATSVSVLAIFQKLGLIFSDNAFEGRIFSTFGNPVFLGSFLLISLPLTFELIRKGKWYGWLSSLAIVIAIALTGSRAALAGLVVLILITGVLEERKVRTFIILSVLLAGFLFGVFYFPRLLSISFDIEKRMDLIKPAVIGIFEKPLFGHGWNRFESYFRQSPYTNWSFIPGQTEVPDTSHSLFVDATFSSGVPFLILLLLFIMTYFSGKTTSTDSKIAMAAVILAFVLSPASMPVLVFSFVVLALVKEHEGIEVNIPKFMKVGSGLVLLGFLVLGMISGYRVLVSDFYYLKAVEASEIGDFSNSTTYFARSLYLQPYEKAFWRAYIITLLNPGYNSVQQAEVEVKKLIEVDPYDFTSQYLSGMIYLRLGDLGNQGAYDKALDAFKVCMYLSPRKPQVYYHAGLAAVGTKDLERAITYWKKAVDLFKEYTDALYGLGYAYETRGERKEALKYYQKALKVADETEKPIIEEAIKRLKGTK